MSGFRLYIFFVFLIGFVIGPVNAQVSPSLFDFARPGLEWKMVETEHFNIIYHEKEGTESSVRTARVTAQIAEEIYEPITSLYAYTPDTRVSIILKDYEDYSNGAAYFFDNKIEIWAPSLDSPLRGDHNWLRNVITHEFTHIIQVQKAMKANRRLPFIYFQLLDYEDVRRPDVLYGYPNIIMSYPIPVLNNPAWLAEGTAQYQRSWLHYDQWDTHRDMLLRTRVLAGEELTLAEMGGFYSHNGLLRETVYNHGFAFTRYLANTYGETAIRDLSASLGEWSNWNVDRALMDAVGKKGKRVHAEWIDQVRSAYLENTAHLQEDLSAERLLESEGFNNFYPQYSPDGRRLAYVSNKGEDYSRLALYIQEQESNEVSTVRLDHLHLAPDLLYTCSLGHQIKAGVGRAFSWHPESESIVYVRRKDTPEGYFYADLYAVDLETKKTTRLTENERATAPAYSPGGAQIAYVKQKDGSANLFVLDLETKEKNALTDFKDGSQVTGPVWHPDGHAIYFGLQRQGGRDLYRYTLADGNVEPVLATPSDERDPTFDSEGTLYFSSDRSGIFNIYRMSLPEDKGPEMLTNVIGGAFMPDISSTGEVVYASYKYDGYKIGAFRPVSAGLNPDAMFYQPPDVLLKPAGATPEDATWEGLNQANDADLISFEEDAQDFEPRPYRNIFTSFSVYPMLRLDQYISRRRQALDVRLTDRGRAETLLRNTKVGALFSSREVLEGLSVFGGVMVGPTSRDASSVGDFLSPNRLLKLERDMFFQLDYRKGLSFIPKRWSPQISLEVFNIRRNVDNGLSVEEFPCTACLPDTTLADLSYNLSEVALNARSKVNRLLLLEVGFRYSPYAVTTERFFSKESQQFIDPFTSRYFIGNAFHLTGYFEYWKPYTQGDVVPHGIRSDLTIEREVGRLLDRFNLEDGFLKPIYEQYRNVRLTLDTRLGARLGSLGKGVHGVGVRLKGSTILGGRVDDFFNDFVGGLIGARGYPFYALGGNETLWFQGSYIFPLAPDISRQVGFLYLDKIYARVYGDAALAWDGEWPGFSSFKKDIGLELRFGLGSFYLLPTAFFVSATYGLDSFDFQLDEGFLTPDGQNSVRYGNDLLWHVGVLFNFDF